MLHNVSVLVAIVMVITGYFYLRAVTGIHLFKMILIFAMKALGQSTDKLQSLSAEQAHRSSIKFNRLTRKQKSKNIMYKYYIVVDDILAALKWKDKGITVEGLSLACMIVTIGITMLSLFISRNVVLIIVIYATVYLGIVSIMYLASRLDAMERKKKILSAIDMLCSNMSNGFTANVETNLRYIDPSIRHYFAEYIRDMNILNKTQEQAIFELNDKLGNLANKFCNTVLIYEKERAKGMDRLFTYIVVDNSKEILRDTKLYRMTQEKVWDFFISLLVIFGLLIYTIFSSKGVQEFYMTTQGSTLIIGYVLSSLITFIIVQVKLGKRCEYKEG